MKKLVVAAIIVLALGGWYVGWRQAMKPHVARIESTIVALNDAYKTPGFRATIEHDAIRPVGFPFCHDIVIDAPAINMIWGNETYSIHLSSLRFSFEDEAQARYQVTLPHDATALYATTGHPPENYTVNADNLPQVWVRVQGYKQGCKGDDCNPPADSKLSEVGFILPKDLMLTASLNGKTQKIDFHFAELPAPIFMKIPTDVSRPLSLFVGMLREALIFTPAHQ